jgi:hypothetical protein
MDSDISKIQAEPRAQRGMLRALRRAQNEHVTMLHEQRTLLTERGARLGNIKTTLRRVHASVDIILGRSNLRTASTVSALLRR